MLNEIVVKRALRMALALGFSTFIYRYFSIMQGFWIPVTCLIVLQPTLGSTLRKGLQRFLGTILGILLGTGILMCTQQSWQVDFLLLLLLFVAFYAKSFTIVNYGIYVVPVTAMMVMLISAIEPQHTSALILARLYDTSLGALIAVIASLIFFPLTHETLVQEGLSTLRKSSEVYLNALLNERLDQLNVLRQQFEQSLSAYRIIYEDSFYEHIFRPKKKQFYEQKFSDARKMGQLMIGYDDLLSQKNPPQDLKSALLERLKTLQVRL